MSDRTKANTSVTAGTATQVAAADGRRVILRLTNISDRVTVYVSQNSSLAVNSAGNKALPPGDTLLLEGAPATGAWYANTHSNVPAAPLVKVESLT